MYKTITWRSFDTDVTALLKTYEIDANAKLGEVYCLSLFFNSNDKCIPDFMRAMQDYKFDKLKKLAIESIEELNEQNLKECNRFMKYCFPNSLKVLYMQSNMTPIKDLKSGLEVLLRSVNHQVYLMLF